MISLFQIILLAIIQGAAELLPVSSSAHVIVAEKLMGLDPSSPEMTFLLVTLHTGTMFAVILFFWPRWKKLFSGGQAKTFVTYGLLATVITGVLGAAFLVIFKKVLFPGEEIESLFRNLKLISAALFSAGLFILFADFKMKRARVSDFLKPTDAVWIGLVQGLCLPFRGFTRSGATISTAVIRGVSKPLAEDFSFFLALLITPPILLREFLRLVRHQSEAASFSAPIVPGILGMGFSFLAGLLALKWLSSWLEKGRWNLFGYYCLAMSVLVVCL